MDEDSHFLEHVHWFGLAELNAGDLRFPVMCRILYDCIHADLLIEVPIEDKFDPLRLMVATSLSLELGCLNKPIKLVGYKCINRSPSKRVFLFSVARSPIWYVKAKKLRSGKAYIVNFPRLAAKHPRYDRQLTGMGWKVSMTSKLEMKRVPQDDNYQLTHEMSFVREDGALFTPSEAQRFLDDLCLFLSFCRGEWVGIFCCVCDDESGEIGLEQWGTGRVTPWRELCGWLDRQDSTAVAALFKPFISRLAEESWREMISHVVYWFQRAQPDIAGPDGACLLLQTTLEKFTWQLLVHEKKVLSKTKFHKMPFAGKLRMMLDELSIPTEIPSEMEVLINYAKPQRLDGPAVLATIRNSIVHPKVEQKKMPFYEASCLSSWYVELAVLSICGYSGSYSNRIRAHRCVGQIEKVPWAH